MRCGRPFGRSSGLALSSPGGLQIATSSDEGDARRALVTAVLFADVKMHGCERAAAKSRATKGARLRIKTNVSRNGR